MLDKPTLMHTVHQHISAREKGPEDVGGLGSITGPLE